MTDEAEDLNGVIAELQARVAALEKKAADLDAQNLELENEVAQRGVKLNCANIALSRAKIAFDESSRRREAMVQEVAHDLRTPLTSIKGAAQNMLDGVAGEISEDVREYVEIVGEHAQRLIGVVNWLVGAMKVSAEPVDVNAREVDLGELVTTVGRGLRPIAKEKGVCLSFSTERSTAYVDVDKLRLVLENLIGNALKFTGKGGEVELVVVGDGDHVEVRVRDTGVGMDEEQQARVFERYYRSPTSEGGSGLGLAISREVVRLHGGDISVTSAPGVGTTFTVRLPRSGEALRAWELAGS